MRDDVREGQIGFKVFGPPSPDDINVDADVFVRKLAALIKALKAADKAANEGQNLHTYRIQKLHTSIPTGIIEETAISPTLRSANSGLNAFIECSEFVKRGDMRAKNYGDCTKFIVDLSRSNKEFGHAEIWSINSDVLRADTFLRDQAKNILAETERKIAQVNSWFKGVTVGSFDGKLQVIDVRGWSPLLKIALSAGGNEIDCVCSKEDLNLAASLVGKRVRITGYATYDGKSSLPVRIEITQFERIKENPDFERWKSAFHPIDMDDWGSEI